MDAKVRATTSIEQAQRALDQALTELDLIPSFDPTIVGFVAHALNSYVHATTAAVELLQQALKDDPNPEVRTWLDTIHHGANLTQHTIGRLLHASAPGVFPLKPTAVNLAVLMERACQYYRRVADPNNVRIVYTGPDRVALVWADRVAVAVVADNILSNAVRASPPGSTVYVEITADTNGVVCSVRDAGQGLSREERDRLLQRVVPGSRSEPGPAGGFDLPLASEFVDLMHGTLWCESEPGNGTRVSFRLPTRA